MLLRNGTLPVVWIPPAELRDQREMLRWRMCLSRMRTRVKNRIHGVLQRYNVDIAVSDLFGDAGRVELLARLHELPPYSRQSLLDQLQMVDTVETQINECEQVLEEMLYPSADRDLLDSLPCWQNLERGDGSGDWRRAAVRRPGSSGELCRPGA